MSMMATNEMPTAFVPCTRCLAMHLVRAVWLEQRANPLTTCPMQRCPRSLIIRRWLVLIMIDVSRVLAQSIIQPSSTDSIFIFIAPPRRFFFVFFKYGHGSARGASPALPIVVRPRFRACVRHHRADTDVRTYAPVADIYCWLCLLPNVNVPIKYYT